MKIIKSVKEMQQLAAAEKATGKSIGFVPTMGYLHEGHLSLLKKAKAENESVILSIFVNPLQFGRGEDLDAYPRDFEHDKELAESEGANFLFYPPVEEMYPAKPSVTASVNDRTDVLCGKSRPGHFDGVATVLAKLFNITQPDRVYFGLKDAQQVAVVEGLVADFCFPFQIRPVDTVREGDGLAKSSRNVYLSDKERTEAPELYKSLLLAKSLIESGERNSKRIIEAVEQHLQETCSGVVDYIELYSYPDLKPVENLSGRIIIAMAVKFSKARLIDNIIMEINE
ncbi:pantoate--beta-alanine ligase [Mesobacillus zeae]|uniref:Pantothenate synthetase n=1 Tax=Mesobacillus zeae TaxID=1917180 RepID=A0A398AYA4_9BACI|nr:pantoate--beta-alanine ligase [Mesobacillus zeae]RID82555.1 pantoate--beta-alanine ligase [Mesobacillus zeae]